MCVTIKKFAWQLENHPVHIIDMSTEGTNAGDSRATCHTPPVDSQEVHQALPAYIKQLHKMSVIMEYSDDICWPSSVTFTFQE